MVKTAAMVHCPNQVIHIGDAFAGGWEVDGGFSGIVVDIFIDASVHDELLKARPPTAADQPPHKSTFSCRCYQLHMSAAGDDGDRGCPIAKCFDGAVGKTSAARHILRQGL